MHNFQLSQMFYNNFTTQLRIISLYHVLFHKQLILFYIICRIYPFSTGAFFFFMI